MQSAALVGFLGVTFLMGVVAAGLAATLRTRDPVPAGIAVAFFALNAGFGAWRMSEPPKSTMRVALIESDDTVGRFQRDNKDATFKAIDAYAAEVAKLKDSRVQLIVLPENISRVKRRPTATTTRQAKFLTAAADKARTQHWLPASTLSPTAGNTMSPGPCARTIRQTPIDV